MSKPNRIRVTSRLILASFLFHAVAIKLLYPYIPECKIPVVAQLIYVVAVPMAVIWSWYAPFFLMMWLSIIECPKPFFTRGKFLGSAWRSSRRSPLKGQYREAGPFIYFGFAYIWARHWALLLDWCTVQEEFSVSFLVQEVKKD